MTDRSYMSLDELTAAAQRKIAHLPEADRNALDEHQARFLYAYNSFNPSADEGWKVRTAERFASNPGLWAFCTPHVPSTLPVYPYEPADYTEDRKTPLRPGGA